MKQILMTMVALIATACMTYAQPGPDSPAMREKAERLKIAFLTERLDLSVEDSQKFWPIYNEFQGERKQIEKRIHTSKRQLAESNKTEADVQTGIKEMHSAKRDMLTLEEAYLEDVLRALGPEKTIALIESEEKFRREIIRKLQQKRDNREGGPGGRDGRGGRP